MWLANRARANSFASVSLVNTPPDAVLLRLRLAARACGSARVPVCCHGYDEATAEYGKFEEGGCRGPRDAVNLLCKARGPVECGGRARGNAIGIRWLFALAMKSISFACCHAEVTPPRGAAAFAYSACTRAKPLPRSPAILVGALLGVMPRCCYLGEERADGTMGCGDYSSYCDAAVTMLVCRVVPLLC